MTRHFKTANDAYEFYHSLIIEQGVNFGDTKALFNVGFYLDNPMYTVKFLIYGIIWQTLTAV